MTSFARPRRSWLRAALLRQRGTGAGARAIDLGSMLTGALLVLLLCAAGVPAAAHDGHAVAHAPTHALDGGAPALHVVAAGRSAAVPQAPRRAAGDSAPASVAGARAELALASAAGAHAPRAAAAPHSVAAAGFDATAPPPA